MTAAIRNRRAQAGLSIIELMIAITIGLLLLAGLASLFSSSSQSQNEMRRGAAQIENGRYAMDSMTQDLQLAGYLGVYRSGTAPAAIPDPCDTSIGTLTTAIGLAVQGYASGSPSGTPAVPTTTCPSSLTANLSPGSDVLIVRRARTDYVSITTVTYAGERYIQANPVEIAVQAGGAASGITCASKADGSTNPAPSTRRCLTPNTHADEICTATCSAAGSPAAYIRKLHVHIYFVSKCNVPSSGTTCTGTADGGRPIPTLKRLELTALSPFSSPAWQVTPIAEGVEFMTVGYGIDDTPSAVNSETGLIGDGATDRYVLDPSSIADIFNVVTVRLDLLVRNPEPSVNYADAKTYKLGSDPTTPTSPAVTITSSNYDPKYRRHVYNSEIRLVNLSSRKETP